MRRRGLNNGVRGPASALTSYLREQNIHAGPMNMYRRAPVADAGAADALSVDAPVAGPSNTNLAETVAPQAPKRRRDADDYDSENLDENSADEALPTRAPNRGNKTGTTTKAKAAAKKRAKKDGTYRSDDDDEDVSYNSPSKMLSKSVGSMETCAKCRKKFPVTKYTQLASPPPGYLCHNCAKASGIDPFKKPVQPKSKRKPEDKRKIVNFEEKDAVPSLAHICISIITEHIEDVEALGNIGVINMNQICKIISRNRKLTRENAMLFYDVENTNISLYDCTLLDSSALCSVASLNPRVESMKLDYCGRMKDNVLEHWSVRLSSLRAVDLVGPFNVRAEAWISFIEGTEHPLECFCITQSPRFNIQCLEALHKRCRSSLVNLRLKEMSNLDDDWLSLLANFTNLTSLDISRPARSVSDDSLIALLEGIGNKLSVLNISGHEDLGDRAIVEGVSLHATNMTSFSAADLPLLTDKGVSQFFGAELKPGASEAHGLDMRGGERNGVLSTEDAVMDGSTDDADDLPGVDVTYNLPPLERVDLSRSPALGSQALAALLQHSGKTLRYLNINQWKDADNETLLTLGPSAPHLTEVDIGWCRNADNFVIKALLDSCPNLSLILCSGCNRLTGDCPRKQGVSLRGVEPGA